MFHVKQHPGELMKRAIRLRIYDPVGNLIREDHVPEGQSLDIKGERPTSLVIGRITLDPSPPPEPYRSPYYPACAGGFDCDESKPCAADFHWWSDIDQEGGSNNVHERPSHNADSVAKDVEGRIHLLLPYKARMACGRKIGEHWDSALNHESVNCPDCLITILDGDGDDVHPAGNPYNCPCGREGDS
jgi:hypothetical protein